MRVDPFALLIVSFAIGGVVALVVGFRVVLRSNDAVARRLAADLADIPANAVASTEGRSLLAQLVEPFARIAKPLREDELQKLRDRLMRAGLRQQVSVQYFLTTKVVLGSAFLVAALWLNARRGSGLHTGLMLATVGFAAGFYGPEIWLAGRIKDRQGAIERGLPDALDLLVTCVEAGLGLDAALQRVSEEIRLPWPVLGGELRETFLEAKAGIPRVDAFRRLAHRTGVQDLKSLAATLTQTEMFGTSIALALRVQAEGIRTRRMQRAEERAAYIAVKLTIPLVVFIMPTMVALVVGPAAISVLNVLLRGGGP